MREALLNIAEWMRQQLVAELENQGHVATSDLLNSVEVAVDDITGGFEMKGMYLYYGRFVDTGRAPGVTRVPIDALLDWIRVKGITFDGKSERQTAFAIQTSIYNNGIPTDGDSSKLRWMSATLEENQSELDSRIREAAGFYVISIFNNIIESSQQAFNQNEAA